MSYIVLLLRPTSWSTSGNRSNRSWAIQLTSGKGPVRRVPSRSRAVSPGPDRSSVGKTFSPGFVTKIMPVHAQNGDRSPKTPCRATPFWVRDGVQPGMVSYPISGYIWGGLRLGRGSRQHSRSAGRNVFDCNNARLPCLWVDPRCLLRARQTRHPAASLPGLWEKVPGTRWLGWTSFPARNGGKGHRNLLPGIFLQGDGPVPLYHAANPRPRHLTANRFALGSNVLAGGGHSDGGSESISRSRLGLDCCAT